MYRNRRGFYSLVNSNYNNKNNNNDNDSIHENMTKYFKRAITNPKTNPQWFTQVTTYLLPKSNETNVFKNYRSITCLSTMYIILTSIVTERIYNFLDVNNILPSEQKECKNGSYGCKDLLLINMMLLENGRSRHRNLNTTSISYRKGLNSVQHTWILKVFQIVKYHQPLEISSQLVWKKGKLIYT